MGFFYIVHAYGKKRVVRALTAYNVKLSAAAILATLCEKIDEANDTLIYRIYVTESIRAYAKSRGAAHLKTSYDDIINGTLAQPQKSGDEIAQDVIKKIGLEVKQ